VLAAGLVEPRLEEQRRAEAACRHIQVRGAAGSPGPGLPLGRPSGTAGAGGHRL